MISLCCDDELEGDYRTVKRSVRDRNNMETQFWFFLMVMGMLRNTRKLLAYSKSRNISCKIRTQGFRELAWAMQ
jgi:hypothetical protein